MTSYSESLYEGFWSAAAPLYSIHRKLSFLWDALDIKDCLFTVNSMSFTLYFSLVFCLVISAGLFIPKIRGIFSPYAPSLLFVVIFKLLFLIRMDKTAIPTKLLASYHLFDFGSYERQFLTTYFLYCAIFLLLVSIWSPFSPINFVINLCLALLDLGISKQHYGVTFHTFDLLQGSFLYSIIKLYCIPVMVVIAFICVYLTLFLFQRLAVLIKNLLQKFKTDQDEL